ncbi:MAG: prepilin-type N-terminal cleavage/methylation domain-containing protein [Methylocystis sp.]|nr:prepilin-type N-terminal cleavage/methylation domain-containing protein [Methylocystis sp.]
MTRVGSDPRAGFTLLETLAALGLLALVMGATMQLLRPPSDRLRVEAAARSLCGALRATHASAMATNSEMEVGVDLRRKVFVSPISGEAALPPDAEIKLNIARPQQLSADGGAIKFFPDGTSTGGDVAIELPGGRAAITVNWLTGEASCASA